jgi:hypothetical protein
VKIRSGLAAAFCAVLALSGCIDTSTRITLAPDGSGTIEKTIVLSKHLIDLMMGMGAKGDAASIEQGMLSEAGLKAAARRMGSGVSFVSAEKITTEKGDGYKALYDFTDISKVKIDENPAADVTLPSGGSMGGGAQATAPEYVTFFFARGSPAKLTIIAPKPPASSTKAPVTRKPSSSAETEQMMATLRPLYEDMRVALSVEVQGKITQTNARFVSGSTVTLMDLDFSKILADEAVYNKLVSQQTQSLDELKSLVGSVPGVKLDPQQSVTVEFR